MYVFKKIIPVLLYVFNVVSSHGTWQGPILKSEFEHTIIWQGRQGHTRLSRGDQGASCFLSMVWSCWKANPKVSALIMNNAESVSLKIFWGSIASSAAPRLLWSSNSNYVAILCKVAVVIIASSMLLFLITSLLALSSFLLRGRRGIHRTARNRPLRKTDKQIFNSHRIHSRKHGRTCQINYKGDPILRSSASVAAVAAALEIEPPPQLLALALTAENRQLNRFRHFQFGNSIITFRECFWIAPMLTDAWVSFFMLAEWLNLCFVNSMQYFFKKGKQCDLDLFLMTMLIITFQLLYWGMLFFFSRGSHTTTFLSQ